MKIDAFFKNTRLLSEEMQITPLLYGSLGLEYLAKENLSADDIDVLIPGVYLSEQWAAFRTMLERNSYFLIDEHEHTFEKNGVHFYANFLLESGNRNLIFCHRNSVKTSG